MDVAERELIRSNLHQVDLLLRKVDRKAIAMIEQLALMQGLILEIEGLKKPIYQLLGKNGGAKAPSVP